MQLHEIKKCMKYFEIDEFFLFFFRNSNIDQIILQKDHQSDK